MLFEIPIYLPNKSIMKTSIFEGYHSFGELTELMSSYNMQLEDYFVISFANQLYAYFYNDWNELFVGKNELYYMNSDYHYCKRECHLGRFDWPYLREEISGRTLPNVDKFGIFDDMYRIDKNISVYYYENGAWHAYSMQNGENELKIIFSSFARQFYRNFFFTRLDIHECLYKYFNKEFISLLDQFYINGAFMVNPFTWKCTLAAGQKATYCSFYDAITKKPLCEMGGKYYDLIFNDFY